MVGFMIYFVVAVVTFFIFRKLFYRQIIGLSRRSHAFISYKLSSTYNQSVYEQKISLFSSMLQDLKRSNGKVLEIGSGSGGSLEFYPKDMQIYLTAIEPNPYCLQYLKKNLQGFKNILLDQYIVEHGEDMKSIRSNSIDLLVCTIVLCSVSNQAKVLSEIKRVLKPAGQFYFIEHVAADVGTTLFIYQNICNILWTSCFDGCNINRDTLTAIKNAGFQVVDYKHFEANLNYAFKGLRPHIMGCATK